MIHRVTKTHQSNPYLQELDNYKFDKFHRGMNHDCSNYLFLNYENSDFSIKTYNHVRTLLVANISLSSQIIIEYNKWWVIRRDYVGSKIVVIFRSEIGEQIRATSKQHIFIKKSTTSAFIRPCPCPNEHPFTKC